MIIEIACCNYLSCAHAQQGGADRIELFENISEGGCTPSIGMIDHVIENISIPTYVMIRPRGGDFIYTRDEIEIMRKDILQCKKIGVKGIVFGILDDKGLIDRDACRRLLDTWEYGPATFHRAIDRSIDYFQAVEQIIECGFERILTSGGKKDVTLGVENIATLQAKYGDVIKILAGAGLSSQNAKEISVATGVTEIHTTAKVTTLETTSSNFNDHTFMSDLEEIKNLRRLFS
jgi:copper homeostasis protein